MPLKCETNLLQDRTEFQRFLRFIDKQRVKSYLEIGSKNGGSFWHITRTLPKGSRSVSVDLPHGDGSFKNTQPNLEACVLKLQQDGYDAHLFIGDSTDEKIVEMVRKLSPFDLCFIDGCHLEPYVWKDWHNYGGMAKIVAFHDISAYLGPRANNKKPIDVPIVWNKVKQDYKHIEIRNCPQDNGIGILFHEGTSGN